jgi:hypothetical protein
MPSSSAARLLRSSSSLSFRDKGRSADSFAFPNLLYFFAPGADFRLPWRTMKITRRPSKRAPTMLAPTPIPAFAPVEIVFFLGEAGGEAGDIEDVEETALDVAALDVLVAELLKDDDEEA